MIAEAVIQKNKGKEVKSLYTLGEYFKLEEKAAYKSEFVNGKIIPMAEGTINHGKISGAIYALLFMLFFDKEDELAVFSNDQKVYIPNYNRTVYTDTCVVLGKTETQNNGNQTILNPTLVVEVASKSTEQYDRTGKFRLYQSLPSFKEYVLVNQEAPIVEVLYKIAENKWQLTSYIGLDKVIELESLGVKLKMADIYKKAKDLKDPQSAFDFPEEAQ